MALFQRGNRAAAGIPHPTAGRPPDWLKKKCQDIVDKRQLIEFLANVAAGEEMEQVVNDQGEAIRIPASVKDRIKATEILLDRGFGRKDLEFIETRSTSPEDSKLRAEEVWMLIKELEESANDGTTRDGDSASLGDRSPTL